MDQKKSILLTTLFVFLFAVSYSQTISESFFDFSENDRITDMILTNDGNILISATLSEGSAVIKLDKDGNVIWQNIYEWELYLRINKIIEYSSNYYCVGRYFYDSYVLKLNQEGDTLYSFLLSENASLPVQVTNIELAFNDNFIITEEMAQPDEPPITRCYYMDTVGQLSNLIFYFNGRINDLKYSNIDNIFILGTVWNAEDQVIIKKYNNEGTQVYSNHYPNYYEALSLIVEPDETFYFTLSNENVADLVKTDLSGDVLWDIDFHPDQNNSTAEHAALDEGKIITVGQAGESSSFYNKIYYLAIADTSGKADTVYINDEYWAQTGKKVIVEDDFLYVAGNLIIDSSIFDIDIFWYKYILDSMLVSMPELRNVDRGILNVYPNPSSKGYIIVSLENLNINENMELCTFNRFGQKLSTHEIIKNQNEILINVNSYPPGLYLIEVYSGGSAVCRTKFIVQ